MTPVTHINDVQTCDERTSARPYESCKIFKGRPAEMPFQNWYTANTNHFRLTDFCPVEIKTTTGLSNKPSTA